MKMQLKLEVTGLRIRPIIQKVLTLGTIIDYLEKCFRAEVIKIRVRVVVII
jgi:hypothetical protein